MKARFHLPGLFEFYELYRIFLPLFDEHREFFYDFVEIGSIYGAPADCFWGGGRVGFGDDEIEPFIKLLEKHNISARLTFSNSLLTKERSSSAVLQFLIFLHLCQEEDLNHKLNLYQSIFDIY